MSGTEYTPTARKMQPEAITGEAPASISTMLAVALAHAAEGRPVFPCDWTPEPKKPDRPSKRPLTPNGFKDATTDEGQIRRWWKTWPNAIIGIPTGARSGIDVLDTDVETDPETGEVLKDGEQALAAIMERCGWTMPDLVLVARTARGGRHRWFKHVEGSKCSTKVLPGVDVRGEGGYVIAPGSRGAVGGPWEFENDLVAGIEDAPDWLAQVFRTGEIPAAAPEGASPGGDTGAGEEDPLANIDLTNSDDIRRALAGYWDADSYDDWAKAALALHRHPQGRELWEEWASTSGLYDADEAERKWSQTRPGKGITARTILHRVPRGTLSAWSRERMGGAGGGDIANARAFADRFAGVFACLFPAKIYVRWTGSRWAPCEHGEEIEAAKVLAQEIAAAAAARFAETGNKADGVRLNAAMALRNNAARLRAMLDLAKSEPKLAMHARDFDGDPWLLGVRNGVVDLRTGELIAPSPAQRIMRQAGAEYDPAAPCPRWLQFLEDVQPDPEIRAFLQRAVGYTLTGLPDEERIFFLHGTGANGKSVYATVLARVFGDYHVTISPAALTKTKYGSNAEADRAVARLPGARLALANETAQGSIWDDQRLKELASRDPIAARRLYQEAFDYDPTHALWIRGNHLPGAHDAGDGFWRRLVAVPFKVQFAEGQRVADLDRQLVAEELPGILAWAVQGCLHWQKVGLGIPASLLAHIDEYRRETDLLGQWLEECMARDPNGRAPAAEAYRSFVFFCKERGVSAPSQRQFSAQLAERSIEATKGGKGVRIYRGYRVVVGDAGFEDLTIGGGTG